MSKLRNWKSKLTFGKHKGLTINQICNDMEDASYVVWLIENTQRTQFPKSIRKEIYQMKHQEHLGFLANNYGLGCHEDWGDKD